MFGSVVRVNVKSPRQRPPCILGKCHGRLGWGLGVCSCASFILIDCKWLLLAWQAADVEARIAEEEADQRARAAEIRREKRLAKIKFMEDMDDRTEVNDTKMPA